MNILEDLQNYVAGRLNADPQLSACPYLVENRRDIDFEIKQALGKQGIVGLVMTPKATYAGAYMDVGIAWQIDELEVDVVENVTVNRGKKDGYVTGQDAAMRLFDVLCPLSGENEGQFSPVSYSEGEDNSLLVNRSVLKCLVHRVPAPTLVRYSDGTARSLGLEGTLSVGQIPDYENAVEVAVGELVTGVGDDAFDNCASLVRVTMPPTVTSIGHSAFFGCVSLTSVAMSEGLQTIRAGAFTECKALDGVTIPSSVTSIGDEAFWNCPALYSVTFVGKDAAAVTGMEKYPWRLQAGCVIHCSDGDVVV